MADRIGTFLKELYGDSAESKLHAEINALLERARRELPETATRTSKQPLTQSDAMLIVYADHVRQPGVAPLRALGEFATERLRGLVSGIHLLPFYPSSSDDGFAVMDYFAVDPAFGSWEDIERLGKEFDLMFDGVFNHASAQGEWFKKFQAGDAGYQDFFVTVSGNPCLSKVVRPRALPLLTEFETARGPRRVWTTFSADQVDLNFREPFVLLKMLEVLLFYVAKGARFIRLDAIAFLWKEAGTTCLHLSQTHRLIQLFRAVLNEAAPGVRLITETNVPHADNISYFGDGTNEAQLVYNFALPPLALHALQTGDAQKLTTWARSLALPSPQVTFFNFLASHDGIGLNPARGILSEAELDALVARTLERGGFVSYKCLEDGTQAPYELNINYLDALSPADESNELAAQKFITAHAIMLSLQGVPGIYFHSLFGSRGDPSAVEVTGIKRRINREKCTRARLEEELAQDCSLRGTVFRRYSELLRLRRSHAALAPAATQTILDLDPRLFVVLREDTDSRERLLCVHNVSSETLPLPRNLLVPGHNKLGPFSYRWFKV